MISIIFVIILAILHTIMYATYRTQNEYRSGMLFAILLPEGALSHPEIQQIQHQYTFELKRMNVVILLSYIPLLALHSYAGIQVIYFIFMLAIVVVLITSPFQSAFERTIVLKREHDWYVNPKQLINNQFVNVDGDKYWRNGISYHNPNEPKLFVPKRVGKGKTINTAKRAGKIISYSSILAIIILCVSLSYVIIRAETVIPVMEVKDESRVIIDYPLYFYQFSLEDVKSIKLVNEYPISTKLNGESNKNVLRGNFRLEDTGKAQMYIYKDAPPYIQIELPELIIYYNNHSPEKTIQLYEEIEEKKEMIKKK